MARKLLKDLSPLAAEILEGKHDDVLDYLSQAITARHKSLFRKGQRVRLKDTKNPALEGKEAVITRVNQKTYSVAVGEVEYAEWDTRHESPFYPEGEFNVPRRMIEALPPGSAAVAYAAKKAGA